MVLYLKQVNYKLVHNAYSGMPKGALAITKCCKAIVKKVGLVFDQLFAKSYDSSYW